MHCTVVFIRHRGIGVNTAYTKIQFSCRCRIVFTTELSDTPAELCRTGFQEQTCIWRLTAETAARAFDSAMLARSLELRCTLPLDGSARAPGSCMNTPL